VTPRNRSDFEENVMKLAAKGFDLDQAMKALRLRQYIFNVAIGDLREEAPPRGTSLRVIGVVSNTDMVLNAIKSATVMR
jgi:rRNA processing protein Krr1/Pno1